MINCKVFVTFQMCLKGQNSIMEGETFNTLKILSLVKNQGTKLCSKRTTCLLSTEVHLTC